MASDSIFKYDSAGQERTLTSPGYKLLNNNLFITVFTRYIPLPISSFNSICIYFQNPCFSSQLLNFLFPSLHTVGPLFNSQGRQLALHQTHSRTKGKLLIVMVRAATLGSAQWDSSCLWLALITDRQTHQALETPFGTKKTQNWLRQKDTNWPLKLSPLAASQIKHGVM